MTRPKPNEDLIDLIYRGATNSAALGQALTGLASQFRCRGAALVSFDNQEPATHVILTSGAWDGDAGRKYLEIAALDPAPAAFAKLAPGTASTTNRILSRDTLRNGVFVNEFYRSLGFRETLGATLFADQSRFALLGLHRGADRATFNDVEIARVERFVPHLVRALQLRRAFIGVEAKAEGLQDVVERLPTGVVLLNSSGAAYFVNRAARIVLDRGDGLTLDRTGRPAAHHPTVRRKLDTLIVETCSGGAGGIIPIPTALIGRAYAVLVTPSSSSLREWLGQPIEQPGVILLIHDPKSRREGVPEVLQSSLGLKPAAAKLVAALAFDDDLKSYAQREGISINTVRFHLSSALAQTETRTQAELLRLVVGILRDLTLREKR